jgi:Zn-dependent protease with chaperone function
VKIVMLIYLSILSAAIVFATNWLALIPWRRARTGHWTERARTYFPVRAAAGLNLWVLPAVLTMTTMLLWPHLSPHWALLFFGTSLGAITGTIPMDREVFPRIQLDELLRQVAVGWTIRFFLWFVFLGSIMLMPNEFNAQGAVLAIVVLALCILWSRDGWIRVGEQLHLFSPPPERLQIIVRDTAAKMRIGFRDILLMRVSTAQALAVPGSRRLLFSERLLELLSDEEIAAISAHELAHLTETKTDYFKRHITWLIFLPWIFFKPVLHAFGAPGFVVLLLTSAATPLVYGRMSRKLEVRADQLALANELNSGTYARALARLYEDSLVPAVQAKDRLTHPCLYDRLLAAGVTPDFPRPEPASSLAWHGHLFCIALGLLAMLLVLRLIEAP